MLTTLLCPLAALADSSLFTYEPVILATDIIVEGGDPVLALTYEQPRWDIDFDETITVADGMILIEMAPYVDSRDEPVNIGEPVEYLVELPDELEAQTYEISVTFNGFKQVLETLTIGLDGARIPSLDVEALPLDVVSDVRTGADGNVTLDASLIFSSSNYTYFVSAPVPGEDGSTLVIKGGAFTDITVLGLTVIDEDIANFDLGYLPAGSEQTVEFVFNGELVSTFSFVTPARPDIDLPITDAERLAAGVMADVVVSMEDDHLEAEIYLVEGITTTRVTDVGAAVIDPNDPRRIIIPVSAEFAELDRPIPVEPEPVEVDLPPLSAGTYTLALMVGEIEVFQMQFDPLVIEAERDRFWAELVSQIVVDPASGAQSLALTVSLPNPSYRVEDWGTLEVYYPDFGLPATLIALDVDHDASGEVVLPVVVKETHDYELDADNLPMGRLFIAINDEIVQETTWEDLFLAPSEAVTVEVPLKPVSHEPVTLRPGLSAERDGVVRVTPLPQTGWYESNWLGAFYTEDGAWIMHPAHGWLYDSTDGHTTEWMYDLEDGWLFLEAATYPLMYFSAEARWLYYFEGTNAPRWFFDYQTGAWITRD